MELSICIATRNRANYIGETIDSIVPQLTPETELIILDGASTDNTESLVRGYTQKTPYLRYIRLENNGGVDKDYDQTVQFARGAYCWLMTDDDILKPGAVTAVLAHLQTGHDLYIANAEDYSNDLMTQLQAQRLPFTEDHVYLAEMSEALFRDLGYHLTYIGAVIIRRKLWLARNATAYYGTYFVHFGVIFQASLPNGARFLAQPLIHGRIGNISWGARQFEIWMIHWPTLVWSFAQFSPASRQSVAQHEPWRKLKALFVARGNGNYSLTEYHRWIAPRISFSWHRLVIYLIAVFPMPLAWLIVYVFWSITRPYAKTTLYDWTFAPSALRWFRWLTGRL